MSRFRGRAGVPSCGQRVQAQAGAHAGAGGAVERKVAADGAGALAHAENAEGVAVFGQLHADAVVFDSEDKAFGAPGGADADAAGAGVPLYVGEQFLDDAVDGDFGVPVQAQGFGVRGAEVAALQAAAGLQVLQQGFQGSP